MENQQTPEGIWLTEQEILAMNPYIENYDLESSYHAGYNQGVNAAQEKLKERFESKLSHHQEANAKLVEALREVEPLIDLIILTLPNGKNKNAVTDYNIKLKLLLQTYETK